MSSRPVVRIHAARLDGFDESVGTDWLTDNEMQRLQAITAPQRKRSFLAGHWLARFAAGEWLNMDFARIAVHQHADGRPYLHVDGKTSPLSISLSHSGQWLVIAVANVPVGIDIEMSRRSRNFDALARFAFSPAEAARISSMESSQRAAAFHQLWTLKEARGKRIGEGFLPEQSRRLTSMPCDLGSAEAISWTFHEGTLAIAVAPGARVEFANNIPPSAEPRYWRFQRVDSGHSG